jgi:hypothetical protein
MKNNRDTILRCMMVNAEYMRLPAGAIEGLEHLTNLYRRIAKQSLECALAWVNDEPCPDHEPAVDAFAWGIVAWADAFGLSVGVDQEEWAKVFVQPHTEYAEYLRPGNHVEPIPFVEGPAGDIIMRLDALWMDRVVKLTAKWGLLHHMKDMPAVTEAKRLDEELKTPGSRGYRAYLESDLKFFAAFFEHFTLTEETRDQLNAFLDRARAGL